MAYLVPLPNYTMFNATGGFDPAIVSLSSSFPSFVPLLLTFVWFIVFLGGGAAQNRRTGQIDASTWAMMASLSTLLVSMVLSLTAGIISPVVFSLVLGITILSAIWYFLTDRR